MAICSKPNMFFDDNDNNIFQYLAGLVQGGALKMQNIFP